MSKVFNVAGGPLGNYEIEEEKKLLNIEVTLKEGYSNEYYLHDKFNLESVNIVVHYSDGTENTNPTNYVYYPAGELQVEDKYITFKAVEGSRIAETQFRITVRDYLLVKIPTYSGELVYNGKLQYPKWSYDATKIDVVEGGFSRSEAGTYSTTFALKDKSQYRWDIDSSLDFFANQTIEWTIQQKEAAIKIYPPNSYNGYMNSFTYIFREGETNVNFTVNYEGSPTGNFITDVNEGHIRLSVNDEFNPGISYSTYSNYLLSVSFPSDTLYEEGDICQFTITVNPDSFPNYKYTGSFNLILKLYPAWEWGSPDIYADEIWFEGLSRKIRELGSNIDQYIGLTKNVQLSSPVLGTQNHNITCIATNKDPSRYGLFFQTTSTLNDPLKPNYSLPAQSNEYTNTKFQEINNQYEQAFPGKKYLANIPMQIQLGGYSNSEVYSIYDCKVVTPAAYQIGLITPDMDTPQTNPEEPYYGDYNNVLNNVYFTENDKRKKSTQSAPGLYVKYYTRSTAVKCVTSDPQWIRHFIICNENGEYELVNAVENPEVYHAPIFQIGALQY